MSRRSNAYYLARALLTVAAIYAAVVLGAALWLGIWAGLLALGMLGLRELRHHDPDGGGRLNTLAGPWFWIKHEIRDARQWREARARRPGP